MFNFNQDLNSLADSAFSTKEVRKGRYAFRVDEIAETKSQQGAQKYEVKMTIVSQADGQTDLVGTSRKQHFVVGHAKANVAKSYEAAFMKLLRDCGVDLMQVKDMGQLYISIKSTEARKPVLVYDVAPQEKDPKYLDWTFVKAATPAEAPAPAPVVPAPALAKAIAASVVSDDALFA